MIYYNLQYVLSQNIVQHPLCSKGYLGMLSSNLLVSSLPDLGGF